MHEVEKQRGKFRYEKLQNLKKKKVKTLKGQSCDICGITHDRHPLLHSNSSQLMTRPLCGKGLGKFSTTSQKPPPTQMTCNSLNEFYCHFDVPAARSDTPTMHMLVGRGHQHVHSHSQHSDHRFLLEHYSL